LICVDDATDPLKVPDIYNSLLNKEKVDLLLGGYGNNSISPAMPVVVEHEKFLVGLMGLGVNNSLRYDRFFTMIPTGTDPNTALTEGFFETASRQAPKPASVAILAADAAFSKNPILGARANASRFGLQVSSETKYSLTETDLRPVMDQVLATNPDVLFLCAYHNDSVALVRALAETPSPPKLVGGAMIGPQSGTVQTALGPLLNGLVNYEYWLPTAAMAFPGVDTLIENYQKRAVGSLADGLGYYVVPLAYAQLQVVEQAIRETDGLNDAELAEYTASATFATVVGDVRFGDLGEWEKPRVLTVQFRSIESNDLSEFAKPSSRVVVAPNDFASGELAYPYSRS
jgi:branched-chain amino acid transport system substrate-binding protein